MSRGKTSLNPTARLPDGRSRNGMRIGNHNRNAQPRIPRSDSSIITFSARLIDGCRCDRLRAIYRSRNAQTGSLYINGTGLTLTGPTLFSADGNGSRDYASSFIGPEQPVILFSSLLMRRTCGSVRLKRLEGR
ncbi:MAG TPA: hypothetical protein VMB77_09615 [Syntrophales bacterium]|nr:hypothetical protein [Syntrophales bacterium]